MKPLISAALLSLLIGAGPALAQSPAKQPMSKADRQAIAKSCSDQANAKGLHGKDRRAFRSDCIRGGGKTM